LECAQQPGRQLYSPSFKDLLASKAGVSPAKLRVVVLGVEYNFVFSGPEPANISDRDGFKDKLKPLLRASMQAKTPSASTPTPLKPESAPTKDSPAEIPTVSQNPSSTKPKAAPRPISVAPPETIPSPQTPTQMSGLDPVKARLSAEYSARKELLKSNPELAVLHAAVVLRGPVSEADFWAHRQVRIALIPCPG
jgi:transcription initiation factor TFIIH subunit 1